MLLCASVISVGAIDSLELPLDGGEESSVKVDAREIGALPGAAIDPDLTEIMPEDLGVDDAVFYCGISDTDEEIPVEDPLEFIRFNTLFTSDDQGADDGTDGEKPVVDEEVLFEDAPPIEGWDPSWLYRSLTPGEGDGSEEFIVDQGTGWEDGLGCGVAPESFVPGDVPSLDQVIVIYASEDGWDCGAAPDGFVPGDVPSNDGEFNEMPDDFVIHAFDPLPLEDDPGKPVDVIDNGGDFEPDGGEVAVEVEEPTSDPNEAEEVHYALDPLPLDDSSGEPVDVVADGELINIRTLEIISSDFDPSVICLTAAPGGDQQLRSRQHSNLLRLKV